MDYALKTSHPPPNERRVVLSNDDDNEEEDALEEVCDTGDENEDSDSCDYDNEYDNNGNSVDNKNRNEDIIAEDITKAFVKEWTDVVTGLNQIDEMFGYEGHDLLLLDGEDEDNDVDDSSSSVGGGSSSAGVGLSDGIRSQTGVQVVADLLQQHLQQIPELQELLLTLGRRTTHGA